MLLRPLVISLALLAVLAAPASSEAAGRPDVAALQVALRANGLYQGDVDGISGPMTRTALLRFQRQNGIRATGKVGYVTRCKLGALGKPLLGQRDLVRGRVGWDVASLEFRLRRFGLHAAKLDGRFDRATVAALKRFQRARGLDPDGIAGTRTFRALAGRTSRAPKTRAVVHTVGPNWHAGQRDRDLLVSCYRESLRVADELAAASVAFPAISAGVYGWPIPDAGRAAIEGVLDAAPGLESVREVRFVLFGRTTYDAFAAALAERD